MSSVIAIETVEAFVQPDYANRGIMHNLTHIHRLHRLATEIASSYEHDPQLLLLGAYFHGTIVCKEVEIRQFLEGKLQPDETDRVIQVAWESQKESQAETIEGVKSYMMHTCLRVARRLSHIPQVSNQQV